MDAAVVVPTYRRPDRLGRLVDALAEQQVPGKTWEIVVVDDCSGPEVAEMLAKMPERVPVPLRVLSTPVNSGPAAARNIGWRATDAPILAFVDDDVVPDPDWLANAIAVMDADPAYGVVQGRTTQPDGVDLDGLPMCTMFRFIDGPGPYFEGCNILYRREAIEAFGGFDEQIAWWGEDTTVGWQVVEAGWKRGWAGDARVVHDIEPRGAKWFVRNGFEEQNLVLLAARHPGYRAEAFWRPWAYRPRDAAFVLAVASAGLGLKWRPALLGVLPYLWLGRPSIRKPQFLRHCVETVAVDAARSAAHLSGAVRYRVAII